MHFNLLKNFIISKTLCRKRERETEKKKVKWNFVQSLLILDDNGHFYQYLNGKLSIKLEPQKAKKTKREEQSSKQKKAKKGTITTTTVVQSAHSETSKIYSCK